ncbi:MAG: BMP family ABC transporter substrate-binding protein [Mogibacterium sp.]|nr:BMP family ABC transporter substrate-binding protein [Mogibacterium sp.]
MSDDYLKAKKAGEKESKARAAAGEYPFLPALDDILPDCDILPHRALGVMEIPVGLISGTKTRARQNSFAPNFMPLLEVSTEFGSKWSSLYKAQLNEGFNDPIKAYEYLHRFYVQEGNKRVSVSRFLDMPTISADVTRVIPSNKVLAEHPEYAEFMKFFEVTGIYGIDCSWEGAYSDIAELLGQDLQNTWPDAAIRSLKSTYWRFAEAYSELQSKGAELTAGDAFLVYLRIYIRDALNHHSHKVVANRILKIQKELMTEQSRDRVALVEEAGEALNAGSLITRTGATLSKVIPSMSYSEKHPLKAAFIHDKNAKLSNWTADHEKGRERLEKAYGGTVVTKAYDNCRDSASFEAAVKDAAEWGAEVVFTTAPRHINDALRAAIEYENIKFLNCSVNQVRQAVRTYYAKIYEAKFIAGLIAGVYSAADGTHKIGYRSDYPIYGTIAAINAFAIGAAMTDPDAKIYLDWTSKEGSNWWWSMVDQGIHVISAVDSAYNTDGSSAHGLCYVELCEEGGGNDLSGRCRISNLASPIWKWGKLYEIIVKTILDGTYNASAVDKKDQATNYWWGMISGVVDIELADCLPVYTRQLARAMRSAIVNGEFNPFDGELWSQDGLIRHANDKKLSSLDIIKMDWLCENIIGEIPAIDALTEDAKTTVRVSGVEKSRAASKN